MKVRQVMNWEDLEALYWRFDAIHKGYGEFAGSSTSERDAFKRTVKQALAEKDSLIERLKVVSWNENVKFIAEAKENLLNEYIHLTELYGEQKHEIRKLKAAEVEKDREIKNLQTCQCDGCDESLEGEAYCQGCWMGINSKYQQLMERAIAIAEFATRHRLFDLPCKFLDSPEVKAFLKEREGT